MARGWGGKRQRRDVGLEQRTKAICKAQPWSWIESFGRSVSPMPHYSHECEKQKCNKITAGLKDNNVYTYTQV